MYQAPIVKGLSGIIFIFLAVREAKSFILLDGGNGSSSYLVDNGTTKNWVDNPCIVDSYLLEDSTAANNNRENSIIQQTPVSPKENLDQISLKTKYSIFERYTRDSFNFNRQNHKNVISQERRMTKKDDLVRSHLVFNERQLNNRHRLNRATLLRRDNLRTTTGSDRSDSIRNRDPIRQRVHSRTESRRSSERLNRDMLQNTEDILRGSNVIHTDRLRKIYSGIGEDAMRSDRIKVFSIERDPNHLRYRLSREYLKIRQPDKDSRSQARLSRFMERRNIVSDFEISRKQEENSRIMSRHPYKGLRFNDRTASGEHVENLREKNNDRIKTHQRLTASSIFSDDRKIRELRSSRNQVRSSRERLDHHNNERLIRISTRSRVNSEGSFRNSGNNLRTKRVFEIYSSIPSDRDIPDRQVLRREINNLNDRRVTRNTERFQDGEFQRIREIRSIEDLSGKEKSFNRARDHRRELAGAERLYGVSENRGKERFLNDKRRISSARFLESDTLQRRSNSDISREQRLRNSHKRDISDRRNSIGSSIRIFEDQLTFVGHEKPRLGIKNQRRVHARSFSDSRVSSPHRVIRSMYELMQENPRGSRDLRERERITRNIDDMFRDLDSRADITRHKRIRELNQHNIDRSSEINRDRTGKMDRLTNQRFTKIWSRIDRDSSGDIVRVRENLQREERFARNDNRFGFGSQQQRDVSIISRKLSEDILRDERDVLNGGKINRARRIIRDENTVDQEVTTISPWFRSIQITMAALVLGHFLLFNGENEKNRIFSTCSWGKVKIF